MSAGARSLASGVRIRAWREVEQHPVAVAGQESVEALEQACLGCGVLIGEAFHVGADEDKAAGAALAFLGGFEVAEPEDAVGDLLLFLFQGGDALVALGRVVHADGVAWPGSSRKGRCGGSSLFISDVWR